MSIIKPNAVPKISTLSNGLRIATIPVQSELSTIGLWIKSGSIYEKPENNGVAHFLEHIIFRGGDKYPREKLEEIADLHGINIKAATTRTTTSFSANIGNNNFELAADILSQIVFNPKIEKEAVDNERITILTEEYEVMHNFSETLWDYLHENAFPNSSAGFPILGSRKNIRSISEAMVKQHHSNFFTPSNSYFICATKIDHKKCCEMIEKATSFIKKKPALDISQIERNLPIKFDPRIRIYSSNHLDRSWMAAGIQAPGPHSPDYLPCRLVESVIGNIDLKNTMVASPILTSFIGQGQLLSFTKKQFCPHYESYANTGILGFLGYTDFGTEQQWINSVMQSIAAAVTPNDDILNMAKIQMKNNLMTGLTSVFNVANELGTNLLLTGKWTSLSEMAKRINQITQKQILQFAEGYFINKIPAMAVIMKKESIPQTESKPQTQNVEKKSTIIKP